MLHKILVTGFNRNQLDDSYWSRIEKISQEIIFMEDADITESIAEVDVLLVKFNGANSKIINFLPDLKYIGTIATGYGKIDCQLASSKGIVVTNTPGYSTNSVAEFTFAVLLEKLRDISRAKKQATEGNYDESGFGATEISGKEFGVVGVGEIGSRILQIARGFGANTSYWNRSAIESNSNKKTIDSLLKDSDIISVNLALNSETENFFDADKLSKIKTGAIIINSAPMEIFNIDGLVARLSQNNIIFIMDHADEMTAEDLRKVRKYNNCILYPPIGYISDEAHVNQQEIFTRNIENYIKGNITNKIN